MIATIESALNTSQGQFNPAHPILLDPERKSLRVEEFEERLSELIIGQERAVRCMSSLYQIFLAGMNQPDRPLGSLLFLGPTGSGKTHTVEAAAEILLGARNVVLKIDCAEFQHSHEIAKLVGSPPGYLGHRETHPVLSQENLDRPVPEIETFSEKHVLTRGPQPPTLEPNKSISRNQRTDGTAPERDPQLDKLETRSGSLDAIAQESSESRRVDGFTYEVRFKNFETKQAQTIFWEYQFKETANPQNISRRRFICGVKIKPDQEKLVQVFSTLGPGTVINLRNLSKGSGKQFDESVVIDRIEYEDGSLWQRKDWNFEEAKLTVRTGGERSGVCRSF